MSKDAITYMEAIYGRIYLITNLKTQTKYVGKTCSSLKARLKQHSWADSKLGRAIRRHGLHSFSIKTIKTCATRAELNRGETMAIKRYKNNSYNVTSAQSLVNTELKVLAPNAPVKIGRKVLTLNINSEFEKLYAAGSLKQRQSILKFLSQQKTPYTVLKNIISGQMVLE